MNKIELLKMYIIVFDSFGLKEKYREKCIANMALLIEQHEKNKDWNLLEKKLDKKMNDKNDFFLEILFNLNAITNDINLKKDDKMIVDMLFNQYINFYDNGDLHTFAIMPIEICPLWYKDCLKEIL